MISGCNIITSYDGVVIHTRMDTYTIQFDHDTLECFIKYLIYDLVGCNMFAQSFTNIISLLELYGLTASELELRISWDTVRGSHGRQTSK